MSKAQCQNGSTARHLWSVHAFGAIVCFLMIAGAVFWAQQSVIKRRGLFLNARHELVTKREQLNDLATQRSELDRALKVAVGREQGRTPLYSERFLNTRTAEIVTIAEDTGVEVDSLQPGEIRNDNSVSYMPMVFLGSAQAHEVFEFLESIDTKLPDLELSSVELETLRIDSDRVQIKIDFAWFVDPAGYNESR